MSCQSASRMVGDQDDFGEPMSRDDGCSPCDTSRFDYRLNFRPNAFLLLHIDHVPAWHRCR
jgi:hypothetical protein